MKNAQFVDIQVSNKNFFEITDQQLKKIESTRINVRLVDGKIVVKTYRGQEATSAIAALATDSNNRVMIKNLDDLLRTARDARFWNQKKLMSDLKKGFKHG
jgi:ribosome recycling factor